MNIRPVTQWTLYRLRFFIAYAFLVLLTMALLTLYLRVVPPGLGPSEQQSIVTSTHVTFTQMPNEVVDLPYHALQKLSLDWLGLTPFGVRLPSLVIGGLTALLIALMFRRWFRPNVAVISSIIILTSSWFLSTARLGAPFIMIPFWTSLLLLTATYVSQQTKGWKWWRVAFCMSAALSLYTPFMAYLFIAAGLATIAQPHLRYLLRESNKVNLFIGGFFFALLLAPLGWGIYHNPSVARDLLAIPATLPDPWQFAKGLWQAASALINPYNTSTSEVVTPLLSLVVVILLMVGGARLLRDFHSVRAHVLLIWAALLVPIVAFNPGNLTVLLIPAMIVATIGLHQIIRYWYRLFPRNPYARVFGLLPLGILIFGIVQFNYQRYTYGMLYSVGAGATFSQDAFMAQDKAKSLPDSTPLTIVVSPKDQQLYQPIAKNRPSTIITTPQSAPVRSGYWLVQASQVPLIGTQTTAPIDQLVTDHKDDSLRFNLYQR